MTGLCVLAAALDCAPVVLILNQIHMLGRKSDTQEGTKWEGGLQLPDLWTLFAAYAEVRLSVEFEKAMGEVSKFNRAG